MVVIVLPRYEWFNGIIDKFDPDKQRHHVTVRKHAHNAHAHMVITLPTHKSTLTTTTANKIPTTITNRELSHPINLQYEDNDHRWYKLTEKTFRCVHQSAVGRMVVLDNFNVFVHIISVFLSMCFTFHSMLHAIISYTCAARF